VSRPQAQGLVHSIQARLKNEAKAAGRPFTELLELFAIERFLHRLGRSDERGRFVLKGALLLRAWLGADTRPTRDIDLLASPDLDAAKLRALLEGIVEVEVEEDGIELLPGTLSVRPIRAESPLNGLRAKLDARLGNVRLRYQIDVGLGDDVFPPAEEIVPGGMLDFPMASLRAYTPPTTIAEKLEALVVLGEANSRLKDYYDLVMLPRTLGFDGATLVEAVDRTFARRATTIPGGRLDGLSDAYARAPINRSRWRAFLDKGGLTTVGTDLEQVVVEIRRFLEPVLAALREHHSFDARWPPGGPWR
jgi:hypothetical protein